MVEAENSLKTVESLLTNQTGYELLQTPAYQRSDSPSARWNKSAIVGVEYSVHANSFHVSNKSSDRSVLATQKYGTHKMNAYDIFEHLLNLQEPKVYKTIEVPDGLGDTKEKRDAARLGKKPKTPKNQTKGRSKKQGIE